MIALEAAGPLMMTCCALAQGLDPVREPAELPELGRPHRRVLVQPLRRPGIHDHPSTI